MKGKETEQLYTLKENRLLQRILKNIFFTNLSSQMTAAKTSSLHFYTTQKDAFFHK